MSKFFIKRPIVAMVIAIPMVIVGAVTIATLPHRACLQPSRPNRTRPGSVYSAPCIDCS